MFLIGVEAFGSKLHIPLLSLAVPLLILPLKAFYSNKTRPTGQMPDEPLINMLLNPLALMNRFNID